MAADMLVPPRRRNRATPPVPITHALGNDVYKVEPIAASETSPWPGATRSGLGRASYQVGPRELYEGIVSSPRLVVLWVSSAPTVMADGALPGLRMPA